MESNKAHTLYRFSGGGEEPLCEGWAKVQQETAAYQDDQEDFAIWIIAVQDATHALAELPAVQHTASSHRKSVGAPVKRVCPSTVTGPVVPPTIVDITLSPRESARVNHRWGLVFVLLLSNHAARHALGTSEYIVRKVPPCTRYKQIYRCGNECDEWSTASAVNEWRRHRQTSQIKP